MSAAEPHPPDDGTVFPPTPPDAPDNDRTQFYIVPPDATHYSAVSPPSARSHQRRLPRRFGDYELLEELGRGGMGVVYKARHLQAGRLVALKMILSGALASPRAVDRFLNEAKAAMALDHPGIVPIYEIGAVDGQHFFTMQLLTLGSLKQRIQQGPLLPHRAATLVVRLAEAVHHAHQRGVIHRDLTPANVLLVAETDSMERLPGTGSSPSATAQPASGETPSGPASATLDAATVKLTDFGLARMADGNGMTASGEQLGTPSYMSPEQAAGSVREIGPVSDVYSLGALLYCLLTGRPPFQAATPLETMRLVLEQDAVSPRQLNPGVPRDLETVCLKCLEKVPSRRYQSAQALGEELARFGRGEPVQARPVGSWERGWRWCKRNPAVAGLLGTLLLVVLVAFSVITWKWLDADEMRQAAVAARLEADEKTNAAIAASESLKAQVYLRGIAAADLELAQNAPGRAAELLEQCPEELRGWEWHYLNRQRHVHLPQLPEMRHDRANWTVAFSPDGQAIASTGMDGTVRVWSAHTGKELFVLRERFALLPLPTYCATFSPDSERIASANILGEIKIWHARNGQVYHLLRGHKGMAYGVAFSPDGKQLASAGVDRSVKLWDAVTGKETKTLLGHQDWVRWVTFSPDGQQLVSSSFDGAIHCWDAHSGELLRVLREHAAPVLCVSFSRDGTRLASACMDGTVCYRDARTGQVLQKLVGHTNGVSCVAFSPDGRRLVGAGLDRIIKVWDTATGKETLTLRGHTHWVWGVAFSPDGQRLASTSADRTVRIWDASPTPTEDVEQRTLSGHENLILRLAYSPDGGLLASASVDRTVRVWDLRSRKPPRILAGHQGIVWGLAFHPDGKRLATGSWDKTVKLWDAEQGKVLRELAVPHFVFGVAFSPKGDRVAAVDLHGGVRVWDVDTGAEVFVVAQGHLFFANGVAFSADGAYLATSGGDRRVILWDATSGKQLHAFATHAEALAVAFSPDGANLAAASVTVDNKGEFHVWDVKSREEVQRVVGHDDRILHLSFSPDGVHLATASLDKRVQLWDWKAGRLVHERRHMGVVPSATFSPDGKHIASGSSRTGQGEVTIWPVPAVERRGAP